MVTAILVLMALAPFHFIYESFLAPDLRRLLTVKLCALRDEVNALKGQFAGIGAEAPYAQLLESINGLISRLDRIRVSSLLRVLWEYRRDPGFLTRAQERARMLDERALPRVAGIHREVLQVAEKALAVNCITWTPLFGIAWIVASRSSSVNPGHFRVLASLEQLYSSPARRATAAELRANAQGYFGV